MHGNACIRSTRGQRVCVLVCVNVRLGPKSSLTRDFFLSHVLHTFIKYDSPSSAVKQETITVHYPGIRQLCVRCRRGWEVRVKMNPLFNSKSLKKKKTRLQVLIPPEAPGSVHGPSPPELAVCRLQRRFLAHNNNVRLSAPVCCFRLNAQKAVEFVQLLHLKIHQHHRHGRAVKLRDRK